MKKLFALLTIALLCATTTYSIAQDKGAQKKDSGYVFTTDLAIPISGIRNQGSSGTCWAFSTTSFLEGEAIKKGTADTSIALSTWYTVYKNYQEKFVKYVRLDGTLNFAEGGASMDVVHSYQDYGVVLEKDMPCLRGDEKRINFSEMFSVLDGYTKGFVANTKHQISAQDKWMAPFNAILDTYLGKCPEKVTYKGVEYSPKEFVTKGLKLNMDDYVSITSYTHHPFYSQFAVEVPDNWRWDLSYNVPMNEMMEIIDFALANGYTIAWGSDVSENGFTREGIAVVPDVVANEKAAGSDQEHWVGKDPNQKKAAIYNLNKPGKEMTITQEMRQEGYDNKTTTDDHGLQIYGIAHDQNGTKYYMVKNSWGKTGKYQGIWYASVPFVQFKTMDFVVNKNGIPKELRKKLGIK